MQMKIKIFSLTVLMALLAFPPILHALEVKDIEGSIMCMCKDKCGKVLASCSCMTSDTYRKEISVMIGNGKTKKEIIDNFVARFGERVLASPTKTGFNLLAWITPFLALLIAGLGIKRIAQSWVTKKSIPVKRPVPDKEGMPEPPGSGEDYYKDLMENELRELD